MPRRIHITGAAGSGTTTLGRSLAKRLGCAHLGTDEFYWAPSWPPFRIKRDVPERLHLLNHALGAQNEWVLSGSLDSWGDPLIPLFTAVIFLDVPASARLDRLRHRERLRFGPGWLKGAQCREFLEWAAGYDAGARSGRSRPRHEAWLGRLACPVLKVDGDQPSERLAQQLMSAAALALPAPSG